MRIVVLGGGISGLSAAWFAKREFPKAELTLLEASDRVGGWIATKREDGFFFELGPRTFSLSRTPKLQALIRELNLPTVFSEKSAEKRYLYTQGKLRPLSSFWPQLLCAGVHDLFALKGGEEEETVEAFGRRRFSPFVASTFLDAVSLGVYATSASDLSLKAAFPALAEAEEKHRSILLSFLKKKRGEKGLFTLAGGMQTLVEALQERLAPCIHTNTPVTAIEKEGVVAGGRFWPADWIVSALPLFSSVSFSTVTFLLPEEAKIPKGYGYLIPSQEKEEVLGMVWESQIFPHLRKGNEHLVTVFVRSSNPLQAAEKALELHLGCFKKPLYNSCFEAKNALPFFGVGMQNQVKNFCVSFPPNVLFTGAFLETPSVEGCVTASEKAIKKLTTN